jgi:aspartate--ammonia ligase
MNTIIPTGYRPILDLKKTEQAIKLVKDSFETGLASELRLTRVTSPIFVPKGSGINDDLNGVERPVSFPVRRLGERQMEVVQSLAKWKRMALADYGYAPGTGIYTDMNALRPDDDIDAIHSIYVDQWDWELVMRPAERSGDFLRAVVERIYEVMKRTEFIVCERYGELGRTLPERIAIIHAEDALARYPHLEPAERERELAREYGAVFIQGIGSPLSDGKSHGGRAPDYDDWTTPTPDGWKGLNGDIIVWDPVRNDSLELSSMGIRVDREALLRQLETCGAGQRASLYWHKRLLAGEFPQSVGGGIGQSRLCMFFLRKAHIGEVQASVWPDETLAECRAKGVPLM